MATITNFVYCLNVERSISQNGKSESITARGILNALTPEFIPSTFSFSIIFSVLDIDTSKNNTIRILFQKKEDNATPIIDSGIMPFGIKSDSRDKLIPQQFKGVNVGMDLRNVILEHEGIYETKIIVNDEESFQYEIYVIGKRKVS